MKTKRAFSSLALGLGLTLALLWLVTGGAVPAVLADTRTVTNTDDSGSGSLRYEIANASSGDTIDFNLGSYPATITLTSGQITIDKDLTIVGPGAEDLAVSGDNSSRVFEIESGNAVTITDLTVRDGVATGGESGGGIHSTGDLHLEEVRIISNTESGSTFSGGGGLYIGSGGTLTFERGEVANNWTEGNGGGIRIWDATVAISGTEVLSNSAAFGGGMNIQDATATITNAWVMSNTAIESGSGDGGGICFDGSTATLYSGTVAHNSADSGGGLYIDSGASVTLNDTQVSSNSISYDHGNGGGIYNYGDLALNGVRIIGNTAGGTTSDGGGLYVNSGSAMLTSGEVASNVASINGGGVYVSSGGTATFIGTQLIGNAASTNSGGGMYVDYGGTAALTETQVLNNRSDRWGGGLCLYTDKPVTLSGGSVSSNSAAEYGGGLYVRETVATITGTAILSNSASYGGGGLYVYNNGTARLTRTHVLYNTANDGGGLLLARSSGAITATDGCFVYNSDSAAENWYSDGVNAEDNWWGAADGPSEEGPGSGDSVGTGVDYEPFKTVRPEGCPAYIDVSFGKSVSPRTDVSPGGTVTYTLMLQNNEVVSDTNAFLTDTLPSEVDFASWVDRPTGTSLDNDEITWSGTVTAGETLTWTWTVTKNADFGDVVTNTAEFSGTLVAAESDAVFTVAMPPDLTIAKRVAPTIARPGEPITYTLVFSNTGVGTAHGMAITDHVPVGVTVTGVVSGGVAVTDTHASPPYVWEVEDLAPGEGGTITIFGTLDDPLAVGTLTNAAVIASSGRDSDPGDNGDAASLVVVAADAVVGPVTPSDGGTVTHTDGTTVTVHVPAGAVTETLTLVYTPQDAPAHGVPGTLQFAGQAFDLTAYLDGVAQPGYQFKSPITVTIHYSDDDVEDLDEETLELRYWDDASSQWLDAACGEYDRHPNENWLVVEICHLTDFGLLGQEGQDGEPVPVGGTTRPFAVAPRGSTAWMLVMALVVAGGAAALVRRDHE